MNRILSIDPSGTGTTGIYFRNGKQERFNHYQGKEWQKHYDFIASLVKVYRPNILLYEHTNFISLRGKDMTALLKLFGGIECLKHVFPRIEEIRTVPVNQVKSLKDKLLKGIRKIDGLEFAKGRGKGWSWKGQKISPHELDAWLVYFLGKKDLEDTEWYEPHCEYCNEFNCVCPTICRELCENCGEEQCFCEPEPEEEDHD